MSTGAGPVSTCDVQSLVAKVNQVPDSYRRYDVRAEYAIRDLRIPADLLAILTTNGFPHRADDDGMVFDSLDLTNAAIHFGCGFVGRTARRLWASALSRRYTEPFVRYLLRYTARCLDEMHEEPCRFTFALPGGEVAARTAAAPGNSVGITRSACVPTAWPPLPAKVLETFAALRDVDFFLLPEPLNSNVDFIGRTGLGHCHGASNILLREGLARGLEVRQSFGLLLSPPFGTGHFWTEFKVDDVWVPADPLTVRQLLRWNAVDAADWPPSRSPGSIFVRVSDRDVPLVAHPAGPVVLSVGAAVARANDPETPDEEVDR